MCLDIYNRKRHTRNYVVQVHGLKFALTIALLTAFFASLSLKLLIMGFSMGITVV